MLAVLLGRAFLNGKFGNGSDLPVVPSISSFMCVSAGGANVVVQRMIFWC
jgi:hypothetical protein